MADETIELTEVQEIIGGLSSPTDEEFVQATRDFSDGAIAGAAAQIALAGGGGGGGAGPDFTTPVTITPTDSTVSQFKIRAAADPDENYPYLIDAKDFDEANGFQVDNHGGVYINMDSLDGSTFSIQGGSALTVTGDIKIGFFGASPVAQQTGVAVDAASIHAALVALGLITA